MDRGTEFFCVKRRPMFFSFRVFALDSQSYTNFVSVLFSLYYSMHCGYLEVVLVMKIVFWRRCMYPCWYSQYDYLIVIILSTLYSCKKKVYYSTCLSEDMLNYRLGKRSCKILYFLFDVRVRFGCWFLLWTLHLFDLPISLISMRRLVEDCLMIFV